MDIFENEQSRFGPLGHGVYAITSAHPGLQKLFLPHWTLCLSDSSLAVRFLVGEKKKPEAPNSKYLLVIVYHLRYVFVDCSSCSVAKLCPTLYDPSTSGFPVLRYLLEFAQVHAHWICDSIGDAILPAHPLPPSSFAFSFVDTYPQIGSLGVPGEKIIHSNRKVRNQERKSWENIGVGQGRWSRVGHHLFPRWPPVPSWPMCRQEADTNEPRKLSGVHLERSNSLDSRTGVLWIQSHVTNWLLLITTITFHLILQKGKQMKV